MTEIAFGLVMFGLGIMFGFRLAKLNDHKLAERSEPKGDAAGKRDPTESSTAFEPPIWSGTPLHEYMRGHPENPFCCECGGGQFHAVHASPSAGNQELWKRIQRGEGARKQ